MKSPSEFLKQNVRPSSENPRNYVTISSWQNQSQTTAEPAQSTEHNSLETEDYNIPLHIKQSDQKFKDDFDNLFYEKQTYFYPQLITDFTKDCNKIFADRPPRRKDKKLM